MCQSIFQILFKNKKNKCLAKYILCQTFVIYYGFNVYVTFLVVQSYLVRMELGRLTE